MALLTLKEVEEQIVDPFLEAIAEDLEKNPIKPGEYRDYQSPLGGDFLPLRIRAPREVLPV